MCSGVLPFLSSQSISAPSEKHKQALQVLQFSMRNKANEAERSQELTILDDRLRPRKPAMDGSHVEGSLPIFTL